jgi:hypothetical protein
MRNSMGLMMPWVKRLSTAPEMPCGVMAAIPSREKPMCDTEE